MGAPLRTLSDDDEFQYTNDDLYGGDENVSSARHEESFGELETGRIVGGGDESSPVSFSSKLMAYQSLMG